MSEVLDKIVVGINKGVTSAKTGAKSLAEKAKINSKINELKEKNKQASIEIGHKVYEMYRNGKLNNCSELRDICVEIDYRFVEIKKQQELLKNIDN